jgi:signal transduction histidine kinase
MSSAEAAVRPIRRINLVPRDWLVPLGVLFLAQLEVWAPYGLGNLVGPKSPVSFVYLLTSLSLLWRKRTPVAVLAFVVTADSALFLAFGASQGLGTFLPILVAFYSVGRYASASSVFVAAPLVLLGTAIHDLKDPAFAFGGAAVFFWVVLAAAWPLGRAFHTRETDAIALAARASSLEQERERLALEAVAAERGRIARELHDVVGHGISVTVLQLVAALGLLDKGDSDAVRGRLLSTERTARETLAEMRRLLELLDEDAESSLAPQPTLARLNDLVAETRAAGLDVDVTTSGTQRGLPAGVELAAYRIIQESLTNVIKHAGQAHTTVAVAYEPDDLVVVVSNDGDIARDAVAEGRGITGMRERAALYHGELEVGPQPAGGFTVRARLPVRA